MTEDEAEQLAGLAYNLRCATGHTSTLFGSEQTYGYSHYGSLFNTADDAVFDYVILGQLRNASRRVIAKALGRPSRSRRVGPAAVANARLRSSRNWPSR